MDFIEKAPIKLVLALITFLSSTVALLSGLLMFAFRDSEATQALTAKYGTGLAYAVFFGSLSIAVTFAFGCWYAKKLRDEQPKKRHVPFVPAGSDS